MASNNPANTRPRQPRAQNLPRNPAGPQPQQPRAQNPPPLQYSESPAFELPSFTLAPQPAPQSPEFDPEELPSFGVAPQPPPQSVPSQVSSTEYPHDEARPPFQRQFSTDGVIIIWYGPRHDIPPRLALQVYVKFDTSHYTGVQLDSLVRSIWRECFTDTFPAGVRLDIIMNNRNGNPIRWDYDCVVHYEGTLNLSCKFPDPVTEPRRVEDMRGQLLLPHPFMRHMSDYLHPDSGVRYTGFIITVSDPKVLETDGLGPSLMWFNPTDPDIMVRRTPAEPPSSLELQKQREAYERDSRWLDVGARRLYARVDGSCLWSKCLRRMCASMHGYRSWEDGYYDELARASGESYVHPLSALVAGRDDV
ncbi:uncharacterized protein BKCO1_4000161 [Diplodia corticola]|uniref:Uncharacterized protein n=1 Tax=Diplodia corticola TaxID=236234 RepID=A0A1J9SG20_9PEZI|nr:uncharacterized protein BKCO1_4000161 [Diplodia corticola]OJD38756.1 hypothetical protein BKCO1_4000161 [Diplodia corticola]